MEIVITFGVYAALLERSDENGHFCAFSLIKFSKLGQVCVKK